MLPVLLMLVFSRVETAPMSFFVKPIARGIAGKLKSTFIELQSRLHFDVMESELGKSAWFAAFPQRVRTRPAFQAALAKGGPYELMR